MIGRLRSIVETSRTIAEALGRINAETTLGELTPSALRSRLVRGGAPTTSEIVGTKLGDVVSHQKDRDKLSASRSQEKTLKREVGQLRDKLRLYETVSQTPVREVKLKQSARMSGRPACFVVMASDWHWGEVVDLEKTSGLNEFNPTVAYARASKFFTGVLDTLAYHRSGGFAISNIVLWFGGDLMTGHIHEELVEGNSLSPVQEVLELRDVLIAGIRKLLAEADAHITLPFDFGNHGRTTDTRRIASAGENSFEYLLGQLIASEFANVDGVDVRIDLNKHSWVETPCGKVLHFTHGDDVRYGGGVGGIHIPLKKAVNGWNQVRRADIHHIGHFHQTNYGRDYVTNGSLKGFDAFAQSIRAEPEPPQQASYVLDAKRGACMMSPIWL